MTTLEAIQIIGHVDRTGVVDMGWARYWEAVEFLAARRRKLERIRYERGGAK